MVMKPLPRSLLLLAYLFMCISATMSFFVPLASFQLLGWALWIYIWAGCLTAGGLMGAVAALLRKTGVELIGLTLLITGYAAYLVILAGRLAAALDTGHPEQISGNLFVLASIVALQLLLIRRYMETWQLVRTPADSLPPPPSGGRQ